MSAVLRLLRVMRRFFLGGEGARRDSVGLFSKLAEDVISNSIISKLNREDQSATRAYGY